jgi:hypothetical protein
MRAFLVACLAFVVIGAGGYFALGNLQEPSGLAYSTDGARINPSWSWRETSTKSPASPADQCEPRKSWQWFFVDFRHPHGEPSICSDSQ